MPFGPVFFSYVLATAAATLGLSFGLAMLGHPPSLHFWADLMGAL